MPMSSSPPLHPKLTAKAALRDLLLWALTCLGTVLGSGLLLFLVTFAHGVRSRPAAARRNLDVLGQALKAYHAAHQRYPSTGEGLRALVASHHLEQLPRDPWGTLYGYELRATGPMVWSLGADGLPGGEGRDADLFEPVTREMD
jgi:general secretion pathway protein G